MMAMRTGAAAGPGQARQPFMVLPPALAGNSRNDPYSLARMMNIAPRGLVPSGSTTPVTIAATVTAMLNAGLQPAPIAPGSGFVKAISGKVCTPTSMRWTQGRRPSRGQHSTHGTHVRSPQSAQRAAGDRPDG